MPDCAGACSQAQLRNTFESWPPEFPKPILLAQASVCHSWKSLVLIPHLVLVNARTSLEQHQHRSLTCRDCLLAMTLQFIVKPSRAETIVLTHCWCCMLGQLVLVLVLLLALRALQQLENQQMSNESMTLANLPKCTPSIESHISSQLAVEKSDRYVSCQD